METERIPPQNIAAEQSILGALLMDKDAVLRCIEILKPESFYRDDHSIIYSAILGLFEKNEPVDLVTLTHYLEKEGKLERVGGSTHLAELLNAVPTAANVEHHARIVQEKAILRRLMEAGTRIVQDAMEQPESVDRILDSAEKRVFEIALKSTQQNFHPIDAVLKEVLDKIDEMYGKKGNITGIPSGFVDLDNYTAGFQNSDLIILAARPAVGKTALALNVAQNAAVRFKLPVAIFSLEMARHQLAQRMLCSEAEIDQHSLKTANLSDAGWKKLTRSLSRLSEAPIFIDDTPGLTSMEIRAKARRLKLEKGLGLVIIDYLQLMQGRSRSENRVQEVSEIARSLKTLARELDLPVIALSQLSRAVEQRHDRRPVLSDLRESGEIEQTADLVCFIHRDAYYNPDTPRGNVAEIIIAKQRNGPVGSVELVFRRDITRFYTKETAYEKVA